MTITTLENPEQVSVDQLRAALRSFNHSFVGDAYGKFAWNWLYVDLLWVHPEHREEGLGSELMKAIEKEAHKKEIYSYHLSTASFQAPIFYQKLGYQICGEIPELPPGYTTYFLKKQD